MLRMESETFGFQMFPIASHGGYTICFIVAYVTMFRGCHSNYIGVEYWALI